MFLLTSLQYCRAREKSSVTFKIISLIQKEEDLGAPIPICENEDF